MNKPNKDIPPAAHGGVGGHPQQEELGIEMTEPTASTEEASLPSTETDPYGSRPACFRNLLEECLFVLTTTVAQGQSTMFTGATICMMEYIAQDLHMTTAEVTWLNAGQTLSAGAFLLFFGRVADLFGRRLLFLTSLSFFTICLVIIGFATSAIYMNVFCGLIGLSSAASVPPAVGKLGSVYDKPSRRRNRAFSCFSAGSPVGFVLGALISGITMQISKTWRAAFWVMAFVYAIFTVAAWWTTPRDDNEQNVARFSRETFLKFDMLGALLAVVGIAMFTASLTISGELGWNSPIVIALIVVGFVLIVGFIYWQTKFRYPLMPLRFWKDRNFTLVVTVLCLGYYGFTTNLFWLSLMWQRIDKFSPLMNAVHLLPAGIGGILVNVLAAQILHRVSTRRIMIVASISQMVAGTLFSAIYRPISYWALVFPALIFGVLAQDLEFIVANMYVMSSLPREQQSVAVGLTATMTRLAATIALGIQTCIYNAVGGSSDGAGALKYRPYQTAFWVSLGGSVLAVFLAPCLTLGLQGGRRKAANARQRGSL